MRQVGTDDALEVSLPAAELAVTVVQRCAAAWRVRVRLVHGGRVRRGAGTSISVDR
jgi:hypothetical protein